MIEILKTIYNESEDKFYFPIKQYFPEDETLKDKEILEKYVEDWKLRDELAAFSERFDIR